MPLETSQQCSWSFTSYSGMLAYDNCMWLVLRKLGLCFLRAVADWLHACTVLVVVKSYLMSSVCRCHFKQQIQNLHSKYMYPVSGFPHLESLGIYIGKFSVPEKSWKWPWSWKVMEFARQWCRWQTQWCGQVPKYGISLCLLMLSVSSLFTGIGGFCEFGKCAHLHTSNPYSAAIILYTVYG